MSAESAADLNARPIGRLLRIAEVERETALTRRTIYRRIKAGEFPNRIRLGPQRVAWTERDIDAWKAEQVSRLT